MPARSWSMSRAEPAIDDSMADVGCGVLGGSDDGEGVLEGIVCATLRKNSSMYCRETGSYCYEGISVWELAQLSGLYGTSRG